MFKTVTAKVNLFNPYPNITDNGARTIRRKCQPQ